jgi:hypothetical protein
MNNKHITVSEDPSLTFGMTPELFSVEGERSSDLPKCCFKLPGYLPIAASFPLFTLYKFVIPSVSEESYYQSFLDYF